MAIQLDNDPITLNKAHRLLLANQYLIMAMLDPDHAKDHERSREAVTSGYASAIEDLFGWIFDGLSASECSLVINSMSMYDAVQRSYKADEKQAEADGVTKGRVSYPGFDGNNETEYMGYARYVRDYEERFTYLDTNDDCNSHMPMIDRYRTMLEVWKNQFEESYELTTDQLKKLLEAR
jgi:uncharacterized protein YfbU (UPF0304 family)